MSDLNEKQKKFCELYIEEWNGTKAYQKVYNCKETTARTNASVLLTKTNILDYIQATQNDLQKIANISKLKMLKRFESLSFNAENENVQIKALENICKMLFYFEPEKIENKGNVNISLDMESIKRINDVLENDY